MFSKYLWLTYSRSENGGYCAYCLAFASLVQTGGNLWKCQGIRNPRIPREHRISQKCPVSFLEFMSVKCQSVVVQLSTSHAVEIQKNREVLRSIIATVEFCGHQGIALQGHRDDSKHLEDVEGNFQAPLKFLQCSAGDATLAQHLVSVLEMPHAIQKPLRMKSLKFLVV